LPFTLKNELTHFIVECTGIFAIRVGLHFFTRIFRLALSNSTDAERLRAVGKGPAVTPSRPQTAHKPAGPRTSSNPYNCLKPSPL
jgi:hypothetical protein